MNRNLPFPLAVSTWLACNTPPPAHEMSAEPSGGASEPEAAPKASGPPDGVVLPGLAHGLLQSPIDINSRAATDDGRHHITMHFRDEINRIENLGHTVQLDFAHGSSIELDGVEYELVQCHFHTPSEHHIDGRSYPLEMHIVNVQPETPDHMPQYLVIGVLFEEGPASPFLDEFLRLVPSDPDSDQPIEVGTVRLNDLFETTPAELLDHYYFYNGSLTTPPYTETVRWVIAKHVFHASSAQVELLTTIEGHNARHVRALYGRQVTSR